MDHGAPPPQGRPFSEAGFGPAAGVVGYGVLRGRPAEKEDRRSPRNPLSLKMALQYGLYIHT
jgi:hypothetical protein